MHECIGIVTWARCHGEHAIIFRIKSDNRASATFEQLVGIELKFDIEIEHDIFSRNGRDVF
ncbi:Uncharacterised protein [Vibrio cholerae]|nr:Uncharacterised protein [Vibrio cholerae]